MLYPAVAKRTALIVTVIVLLLVSACRSVVDHGNANIPATPGAEHNALKSSRIPQLVPPLNSAHKPNISRPDRVAEVPLLVDSSDVTNKPLPTVINPELYTIVADQVPVKEILQTIARDADAQVSFIGEIDGNISLSLINQPLNSILQQISAQTDVRYEVQDDRILLIEDRPFIRTYEVDYLNMQRLSESRVDLATQIGSIRADLDDGGSAASGSNGSQLFVENKSVNSLWTSVVRSVSGILGEKADAEGGGSENVFVNPESGIITVRAKDGPHKAIAELLEKVTRSAQRQVLIEATVVEVTLNDKFESGVDWQVLNGDGGGDGAFQFSQILAGLPNAASVTAPITALLSYSNENSVLGNLTATLKLLQQFGEVQVLSSPKIIAMNNQPAVLKVVDNRVYFTFEVDRIESENGDERTVVDSTVHSVPIGLVMNVTPFISKDREVILNVRPTISRILNFAEDPSPALAGQNQVRNLIPEIQVREMESLLRVQSGNVAIIGGLMQNKVDNRSTGVPGFARLPLLGKLFTHETKNIEKTELLVFLKPTVIDQNYSTQGLLENR